MRNFTLMGQIHGIGSVAYLLALNERLFELETWRQTYRGTPHAGTKTIFLRSPPDKSLRAAAESLEVTDSEAMNVAPFRAAIHFVGQLVGRPLARAMIVRLLPGREVADHIDQGPYAAATERIHVPIVTNPRACLICEGEVCRMKEGEVWWFDKHRLHAAQNHGAGSRDHLIVDTFRC